MAGSWPPWPTGVGRRAATLATMADVLLIADDVRVRDRVEAALAGPRSKVVTITDSRDAVRQATETDPSAILIDLQVGSMGGMAVVRALKDAFAVGGLTEVPLVMLLDRPADEFLAGRAGASTWVVKPFTAQELRAVLPAGSAV